jgi:predicted nucleic acid-binding Zn ribbon protein
MKARPRRPPAQLADTLTTVLQRIDPDQRLDAYRVWTFWDEAVGPAVAQRAQPAGFRAGVLSVWVSSHTWMQELQFMKDELRGEINRRLGQELIRDIYFVSGTRMPKTGPPPPPRARRGSELAPTGPLPRLRDPALEAVFARIARAHTRRRGE